MNKKVLQRRKLNVFNLKKKMKLFIKYNKTMRERIKALNEYKYCMEREIALNL
jgi:hypothetical protein